MFIFATSNWTNFGSLSVPGLPVDMILVEKFRNSLLLALACYSHALLHMRQAEMSFGIPV